MVSALGREPYVTELSTASKNEEPGPALGPSPPSGVKGCVAKEPDQGLLPKSRRDSTRLRETELSSAAMTLPL